MTPESLRGIVSMILWGNPLLAVVRREKKMNARTNLRCWLIMSLFLLGLPVHVHGAGREYYVAGNGDDRNPGTEALPFRTINRACRQLLDRFGGLPAGGLTIWIRDGIYRETVRPVRSGTPESPIRFVAYPGEEPVVSGADILDVPWTLHAGKIYKAPTTVEFEQLFVDGQMMQEARWPNTPTRDLVRARHATCDNGTDEAILIDDALPPGDWNNAYVHIRPGPGWSYCTKQITNYEPGKSLEFSDGGWQLEPLIEPAPGKHYWLFGSLAGLDRATEWFLDAQTHTVYLWCPGDPDPARHTIEVKRRDHAFDLSGCGHIRIEGLRVFAAGIVMEDSTHCSVVDCHLKYPLHRRIVPPGIHFLPGDWKSNKMSGSYNEWRKTAIACSIGQGIYDLGDHSKVTNCIIHDWDLISSGTSGIAAFNAPFGEYTYNTICEGGSNGITLWTPFSMRVEHNHIYNIGALSREGQCIGVASTPDGGGTIIAYNRLHDSLEEWCYAINVGGGACGLRIHHNLIWNMALAGFVVDAVELDNEIYNNTVFNCAWALNCGYVAPVSLLPQQGTQIINNIANGPMEFRTKPAAQHHNGYFSVDANGWPTADSGAIDTGVVIPGITDGYVGAAPDIGCFEVGTEGWKAGADWEETAFTRVPNTEGFETGDFIEFDWRCVGDVPWLVTSQEKHSGFYGAKSGTIDDDGNAGLQVTLDCRPGEITFWRKVSCEQLCDCLTFSLNGVEKGRWSGEQDWAKVSFPVSAGRTAFEWKYSKDGSSSRGQDSAWIDDVEFPIR